MKYIASLLMAFFLTGCFGPNSGGTSGEDAVLFELAAYTGASIELAEHPGSRPAFRAAQAAIKRLIDTQNYSPAELVSALKDLKVKEFKGPKGTLIVTAAVILWQKSTANLAPIDNESKVLPVLLALDKGFSQALAENP